MRVRVIAVAAICLMIGIMVGAGQFGSGDEGPSTPTFTAQAQQSSSTPTSGPAEGDNTSNSLKTEVFQVFLGSYGVQCIGFRDPKKRFAVSCNWEAYNEARNSPRGIVP